MTPYRPPNSRANGMDHEPMLHKKVDPMKLRYPKISPIVIIMHCI